MQLGADVGVEIRVHSQDNVLEHLPLELLQQRPDQPGQVRLDRQGLADVREHLRRNHLLARERFARGIEILDDHVGRPGIAGWDDAGQPIA